MLRELRRGGYEPICLRVDTAQATRTALEGQTWDAVISDYSLPGFSGLAALRLIQEMGLDLPFILVSGTIGEDVAVEAMKSGAHDFLVKGKLTRLVPALERELREAEVRRQRRLADETAARLAVQNRLILESAGEGLYGLDCQGVVTFVNSAAARMLGYEAHELIGRFLHSLSHHSKRDGTNYPWEQCPIRTSITLGSIQSVTDEVLWKKDGTHFPVEYVSTPIREDGKILGAVVIFRDVTEQRRVKEQLIHSQKMEVVGRLAGGVAHDFNNLLTVISGFASICKMAPMADDSARKNIEYIEEAASRAADLTRQLLAFARHEVVVPRVFNPNNVIVKAKKMLHRLIGEDIDLVALTTPDVGLVKMDPAQFEQILMNLVVNARDAMPVGGKIVLRTAGVTVSDEDDRDHNDVPLGEYAVLTVEDTGRGMPPEVLEHLFEPFFTTKPLGKGTGLGLATCHGIVTEGGGQIRVDSRPGQGTTFRIYLPRVRDVAPARKPPGEEPPPPCGTETVLLVEDDALVRELIARVLRDQGYTVLEAANGDDALRLAASRHDTGIDLLLTDIIMRGMNGWELAQRVGLRRPEMKTLYISGYTDDSVVRRGVIQESSATFLQKPFTPEALARKVREALDGRAELARDFGNAEQGGPSPERGTRRDQLKWELKS